MQAKSPLGQATSEPVAEAEGTVVLSLLSLSYFSNEASTQDLVPQVQVVPASLGLAESPNATVVPVTQ